jgi:acetyl-CoA carboxylase biotin carboxyl carrier protein
MGEGGVDIDNLRALLEVLTEKDIAEFEHEDEAVRIRIVRGVRVQVTPLTASGGGGGGAGSGAAPQAASGGAAGLDAGPVSSAEPASGAVDVTSPFVGTFYRAASPDAPSFVEVGSVVRAGQTLCIIEAMKLMNEIEAEHSGTIVEVFAQNGKAVEFGQKLFRIKKT